MTELSVIVPAYNAEATLEKCLDSIVGQNMEDMEVIIVDDGSTDKTGAIADSYAEKYSYISVIHQKNKGQSAARNAGMLQAKGEYLTFVDSDDHLLPHIYENQMVLLHLDPAIDLLEFSLNMEGEKNGDRQHFMDLGYDNGLDYWVTSRGFRHYYSWNKILKRSLLQNEDGSMLLFPENRFAEDLFFLASVFSKNPKIQTSSHIGYTYIYNPNGITANIHKDALNDICDAHEEIIKVLDIEFNKFAPDSTRRYYLDVLNHQLDAKLLIGRPMTLKRLKVPMSKATSLSNKFKVFVLNTFGLSSLVCIMSLVYALTFKKARTK